MLSFLDFFQTSVQRIAVATAANMCRGLSADSTDAVTAAVPILTNLLQYEVSPTEPDLKQPGACRCQLPWQLEARGKSKRQAEPPGYMLTNNWHGNGTEKIGELAVSLVTERLACRLSSLTNLIHCATFTCSTPFHNSCLYCRRTTRWWTMPAWHCHASQSPSRAARPSCRSYASMVSSAMQCSW